MLLRTDYRVAVRGLDTWDMYNSAAGQNVEATEKGVFIVQTTCLGQDDYAFLVRDISGGIGGVPGDIMIGADLPNRPIVRVQHWGNINIPGLHWS
jgi:hypothetical protein